MNFKSAEKWLNNLMSNEILLVLLMILIVIVIIDCNTKMFSKMIEGQSSEDLPKNNIPIRCPNTYTYPKIQNPTNAAKQNCPYKPTELKQKEAPVTGYDSDVVLYAAYDKPLGPTVPRSMQQDYTTLQAFGLTRMPDVVNYLTGPGPQQFVKAPKKPAGPDAAPATQPGVKKPVSGKKEVHVKMYYAPWCGHSNKAKPEFDKVINKHHNKNVNGVGVKASIVHSENDKDEVKKQNIQGFPTYKAHIIQDGKEVSSTVLNLVDRSVDSVEKAKVQEAEKGLLEFIATKHSAVRDSIREAKQITAENEAKLNEAIQSFISTNY